MTIKTRQPTGRVPWPLILIEGGEKAGKSYSSALLSASAKVGQTYWIDLGEGGADEYGAIPGARYLIVDHDGTWRSILHAVQQVREEAQRAADAKEPPVVLVIDSMTAEWDLLKGIADAKARERLAKKGRRLADDAEPQISMDLWNDVNGKHRKLMTLLMTFPGIVVMTAKGKEVAALDNGGRPIEGSKEYKVEGQKNLAFDASVWVRVSRDSDPQIIGARSVHAGIKPGSDRPKPVKNFSLEWLIFEVLKCEPANAHARDLVELKATPDTPSPRFVALQMAIDTAPDAAALKVQWNQIKPALEADEISIEEADALADMVKSSPLAPKQPAAVNGTRPELAVVA